MQVDLRGPLRGQTLVQIRKRIDSKDPNHPGYRRSLFVRYADDFLVGVIGPKQLAVRVRSLISKLHRLKLDLSLEKTLRRFATHCNKRVAFLGFEISTARIYTRRFAGQS